MEEFIDGEEFTYDTVCAAGEIAFYNIAEYRPRPLVGKQVEWISQQVIAHRDPDAPAPRRWAGHGRGGDRGDGLQQRLHAHGVVPHGVG